jgi:hypothetical protein
MVTDADRNMQCFADCFITKKKCVCALAHLNKGTPSGPIHMKLIVQFCPRTGETWLPHFGFIKLSLYKGFHCLPWMFLKYNTSHTPTIRNLRS